MVRCLRRRSVWRREGGQHAAPPPILQRVRQVVLGLDVTVDVITTGEQKNKAPMLETISDVIKFVSSMQISDGRNLALEDYRWAVCSCNSWKWRGCHLSCSAGRRQRRHPLNRWRHHPHQNLPCSYSSVGPGRLRRSRWASRHVSETSFPKRASLFATCTMMSVTMATGPSQKVNARSVVQRHPIVYAVRG